MPHPSVEAHIRSLPDRELILYATEREQGYTDDAIAFAREEARRRGIANTTFEALCKKVDEAQSNKAAIEKPAVVACPSCGSQNVKKRFFGGSRGGAIACFIVGGIIAFEEFQRPRPDPTVLLLLAVFVLAGVAALVTRSYRCRQCGTTFRWGPSRQK